MGLVSDSLPNLIQGVSQQPDTLRSTSQLAAQENCYSSLVEGLIRRPPTEHVAVISTTPFNSAFIHTINRTATQRYKLILSSGLIKVFDLDGAAHTVTVPAETFQIHSAVVVGAGQVYTIAAAPGVTTLDFTVAGFGVGTVALELSPDNAVWTPAATRTTNGTTAAIAIGANLYMRVNITAYTSGTLLGSVTYANLRYLVSTNAKSKMRAMTVADYTFIVNTEKVAAFSPALSPVRTEEGLVFVSKGEYGSKYEVYLDEQQRGLYTTSSTDVLTLDTTQIANQMYQDLIPTIAQTTTLLSAAGSVQTGNAWELDYAAGATTVDHVVTGTFVGTIVLEGSVDGVSGWGTLDTRTTAGSTLGIATGANLFVRARVSAWTSGTITSAVNYKWGGSYTFTLVGSSVWIQRTKPFKLRTVDAQGGRSMIALKGTVNRFSILPETAPNGFQIAIDADPSTAQGKYFVKAVATQTGAAFGPVSWIETVAQGIPYTFNATTLPYTLIRNADDTFTFKAATWINRLVGDANTNLDPSFIGSAITDLFFYKNRLGFLANEEFVLSEIGAYFNFFRTTITQIKDSDVVDSRASDVTVSTLRRSVLFNKSLVMFSDQAQFEIPSEAPMTPKTVRCDVVSKFESLADVPPLNTGKNIAFMFSRDNFVGLKELFVSQSNALTLEAEDVSSHVPAYIPAGAFAMSVSTLEGIQAILTDGTPASTYMYKAAWKEERRVQSAWFRWNFDNYTASNVTVLSADFIGSIMYILVQRNSQVFLEKLRLLPNRVDDNATYVTFLDRRLTDAQLVSRVYNSLTQQTTITLPWNITSTQMVVATRSIANNTGLLDVGRQAQTVSATVGGAVIVVTGDFSTNPLWVGQRVLSTFDLSKIYVRSKPSGSIDPAGILQLLKGYVNYSNTGVFTVRVTPEGRTPSDYIFTGRIVGDLKNILGVVALKSGRFLFSILSNSERVSIQIRSDTYLPFKITSVEWEGNYTKRSVGR